MKKNYLLMFVFGMVAFVLVACGGKKKEETTEQPTEEVMETTTDSSGPEYTSAYVCKMHCEGSGSTEPGKCPTCDMDYIKNDMESNHEGHDHKDGEGHDDHHSDKKTEKDKG